MLIYRFFRVIFISRSASCYLNEIERCALFAMVMPYVCTLNEFANRRILDSNGNVIDELYANFVWRRTVNNVNNGMGNEEICQAV